MISGRIKEGCGAGSSLPASPRRPRPCRDVFWPGSLPPWPSGRLRHAAPVALLGTADPAGLGAPGGEERWWGPGTAAPGPPPSHGPEKTSEPEAGYRPGLCRCLPAGKEPGYRTPCASVLWIPAKSRTSELSILIEIAGLGTAGGCLYRLDFCCSGEHITND